jgi:hypothetical protein
VRNVQRILVWNPEGKSPLGITRRRREGNIKMNLQEVGWEMDWISLPQDRDRWRALANEEINPRFT